MLEVRIDLDYCMGAGECVHAAPGTFAMVNDMTATVRDPMADSEETIISAARLCPNSAITVYKDGEELE